MAIDPVTDISDATYTGALPAQQQAVPRDDPNFLPATMSANSLMLPVPQDGGTMHLFLKRHKSLFRNSFELCTACTMPNGKMVPNRTIALVQRCLQQHHVSYKIFDAAANVREGFHIGKLRSNFDASEFELFSAIANAAMTAVSVVDGKGRLRVGTMCYVKMKSERGQPPRPLEAACTLQGPNGEKHELRSINAVYDANIKAFKIDYSGRQCKSKAVAPSSKNMRLEHDGVKVFDLIKLDKGTFSVEYQWPLTGLQALGVALSRFGRSEHLMAS